MLYKWLTHCCESTGLAVSKINDTLKAVMHLNDNVGPKLMIRIWRSQHATKNTGEPLPSPPDDNLISLLNMAVMANKSKTATETHTCWTSLLAKSWEFMYISSVLQPSLSKLWFTNHPSSHVLYPKCKLHPQINLLSHKSIFSLMSSLQTSQFGAVPYFIWPGTAYRLGFSQSLFPTPHNLKLILGLEGAKKM